LANVEVAVEDATYKYPPMVVEPVSAMVNMVELARSAISSTRLPVSARSFQTEKEAYGDEVPTETRGAGIADPSALDDADKERMGAPVREVAKERALVAAGMVDVEEEA